jgi:protein-disulfide isomerase
MSLGDPAAKVKVVEYASLSCPHCMRFNNEVFPAFKAKYIDTGKVQYTFREFITPPAEVAAAGALLARCAGKDKYFAVIDEIYRGLPGMIQTNDFRGGLLRVAQSAGMTQAQFDSCVSDQEALKALNDRVEGFVKKEKIDSTPTFVVGDQKLVGEQTLESLSAVIDPMLK